jgi:hypothetical protein
MVWPNLRCGIVNSPGGISFFRLARFHTGKPLPFQHIPRSFPVSKNARPGITSARKTPQLLQIHGVYAT